MVKTADKGRFAFSEPFGDKSVDESTFSIGFLLTMNVALFQYSCPGIGALVCNMYGFDSDTGACMTSPKYPWEDSVDREAGLMSRSLLLFAWPSNC
jgi:hypothetical protein